jgi:hypothetical protein
MTIEEAHAEVNYGWTHAYSPDALAQAVEALEHKPLGYQINIFVSRLFFRGIYFPMMGRMAWPKWIAQNRRTIFKLVKHGFGVGRGALSRNPDSLTSHLEAIAPSTKP